MARVKVRSAFSLGPSAEPFHSFTAASISRSRPSNLHRILAICRCGGARSRSATVYSTVVIALPEQNGSFSSRSTGGFFFCETGPVQNLIAFECGRRAAETLLQAGQATKGAAFEFFDQRDHDCFGGVGLSGQGRSRSWTFVQAANHFGSTECAGLLRARYGDYILSDHVSNKRSG